MEFVDCIYGVEDEVGVEMDDLPNALYAIPPKDPKLIAKAKPNFSFVEAKTFSEHQRKPFKLEGYEIYIRTGLSAVGKQAGMRVYVVDLKAENEFDQLLEEKSLCKMTVKMLIPTSAYQMLWLL